MVATFSVACLAGAGAALATEGVPAQRALSSISSQAMSRLSCEPLSKGTYKTTKGTDPAVGDSMTLMLWAVHWHTRSSPVSLC